MDEYRTAYHFQPPSNWMNGPVYYNGIYHLFYQYNPEGARWGNLSWGHSVSTDLINWTILEVALSPTDDFDKMGCFSGSVTILPGNLPVILYTGADSENKQVQNIAFPKNPSDRLLREWTKPAYNPIISPKDGIDPQQFRDPTTGWLGSDGKWRVAIGAQVDGHGLALLYKSADFIQWERAEHPFYFNKSKLGWECVDFFPVPIDGKHGLDLTSINAEKVKHIFKVSFQFLQDHYILGRYDEENDTFLPDKEEEDYRKWSVMDFGKFFASKSFYDSAKQRRIVWAWSIESDTAEDSDARGWSGIQTVPRSIWLDSTIGQLFQWPIEELESLRGNEVELGNVNLKTGEILKIEGLQAAQQADIEVSFELPSLEKAEAFDPTWILDPQKYCRENGASVEGGIGPFGLKVLASENFEEYTAVFFRVFKASDGYIILMCSEQERSSLRAGHYEPVHGGFFHLDIATEKKISLRTLIDHSVIESFGGGGRACITARVYPTHLLTGKTHLYTFNSGSETVKVSNLKAWDMAKARISTNSEEVAL